MNDRGASWRKILKIALTASCAVAPALLLSGCAASPPPPTTPTSSHVSTITEAQREQLLRSLLADLRCEDAVVISDELTFYDDVIGRDCYPKDGDALFVRVYRSSTSVAQNLADWQPTLGADRQAVWGTYWYVVGPPLELAGIQTAQHVRAETTPPTATPLTPRQDELTTCGRFMESATRAFIFQRSDYVGDQPDFQEIFPGAREMIEGTLTPALVSDLRKKGEDKAMASIVDQLPRLKALCNTMPRADSYSS